MSSLSKPNRQFLSPTTNNQDTGREQTIACARDMVVLYNECLKNHAVSLGGHALDGCGEFTPKSTTILTDPPSLRCDACGCHRNFHRRSPSDSFSQHRSPPSPLQLQPLAPVPNLLLSLSSGFFGPSDQEVKNKFTVERDVRKTAMIKKHKRTKFTAEQKVKMRGFAERAGWKINGWDEKWVREFCSEVGIERKVLKVWIHNNKYFNNGRSRDTTSSMSLNLKL
ncbi:Zinc-finger homeodomain protein 12 [Arabidopsis thaliana]|uniref:ZHD12 n=2 Tax=Arabidopsis TaxID=3701 RepID=A0A178UPU6_ARATH|nr:ZF-HD homeobox protein Cys/His-rich dimerization domain [Arabidopsis thaliana x Arabidopsis arenosa]OAO95520.1 ZHD12 [Arabidopsis thaliana]